MSKKPVIRTCCVCRKKDEKKNLFRIVRLPDGTIVPDPTEKHSGRGVYLCRDGKCISNARRTQAAERSLQCSIPEDIWSMAEKEIHG